MPLRLAGLEAHCGGGWGGRGHPIPAEPGSACRPGFASRVPEAGVSGGATPAWRLALLARCLGYVSGRLKLPKGREGLDAWDIFIFWMVSKAECFCQVTQPERPCRPAGRGGGRAGALPPLSLPSQLLWATHGVPFQPGTPGRTSCALSQQPPNGVAWVPKGPWWVLGHRLWLRPGGLG